MTSGKSTVSESVRTLTSSVLKDYAEVLRRYLLRRVQRPEDAEDLAQEVFELYLRKRDHIETVRDPLAYLFRIAFHVVGEALRKTKRNPVTYDSSLLESRDDSGEATEESSVEEELALRDAIAKALEKLPENHVKALMLVEGQGMSHQEAAAALGLAPNSVTVYVSQARAAFKLALDAEYSPGRSRR